MALPLAFLDSLNPVTMMMIGVIALLLFGERLPEVGRSLGKKLMDFKKNVEGIQQEIRTAATSATSSFSTAVSSLDGSPSSSDGSPSSSGESRWRRSDDYEEATAPKFVPPPREAEAK